MAMSISTLCQFINFRRERHTIFLLETSILTFLPLPRLGCIM
jgi:hypothetical protein